MFRRERLEVHPEATVLVGLNDVGKSTLLEAMRLYGVVGRIGFRELLASEDFQAGGTKATMLAAGWEVDGKRWTHTLLLDPLRTEERLQSGDTFWSWRPRQRALHTHEGTFKLELLPRYASLAQITPSQWQLDTDVDASQHAPTAVTGLFQTPPAYLFEPQALARPAPVDLETPRRNGYGWASWLQTIINRRDGGIEALEMALRGLFPYFDGVLLRVVEPKRPLQLSLFGDPEPPPRRSRSGFDVGARFEIDIAITPADGAGPLRVPAAKASSGLLLALAHLALVHAMPEGAILLLEEPENGLNARITLDMMRMFLAAVRQRRQQLILTTHNPWWLDLVPADGIRVLTRDEHGSHIHVAPKERLRSMLDEQDLYPSEVVGTYGPEGLLYLDRSKP